MRVVRAWPIVFRVESANVLDADLTNYHLEGPMSESNESLPYDSWLRRDPSHSGRFVSDWMEDVDGKLMPAAEAARKLGVSIPELDRVLNGRGRISVALAPKLEAEGWGKADAWIRKQVAYDLARQLNRIGQWPDETAVKAEAA
ncbi:MAG: hypothetical protein OXN89_07425 [Bryobacterales bacterium]|nr:hypothetical protein [Bryobacterales bacterium]